MTSTSRPTATQQAAEPATAMLIDRCLPAFDVTLIEHTVVNADVATTWRALTDLDLLDVHSPLLDAAFFVRGLPAKVAGLRGRTRPPSEPAELKLSGVDEHGLEGWLPLGRIENREIALGAVGRFWKPNIEWFDVSEMTPEEFAEFDDPGWGRIAANFTLRPYGEGRTLLSYEARTATNDDDSAKKFARYWGLVRPFVGHVMRAALATVRRNAEQA
ncbi:MAG TPA: hypothetical protein VFZ37_19635 [Jiangellaceae bacterium]